MKDEEEMDEQINLAYESKDEYGSRWPGMSYEDGVIAALSWAKGDEEAEPMEEN